MTLHTPHRDDPLNADGALTPRRPPMIAQASLGALALLMLAWPGTPNADEATTRALNRDEAPPAGSATDTQAIDAELARDIDKILSDKRLKGVRVSVHVRDLHTDKTLYEQHADRKLNPASNAKIITAAAALDRFGPSHTYKTELWGHGKKTGDGQFDGDLALVGGGDPFLEWSHLLEMAERARRKGIKTITGDLLVDDTTFDDVMMPPAFDQKREEAPYRTTVGGVAAAFSAMTVIVSPGKEGKRPAVSFDPPCDYAIIDNKATTVASSRAARKDPLSIKLARDGQRTRVIIRGKTHQGASVRKRVDAPTLYAGHLMKAALKRLGVELKGKVRRAPSPKGGRLLARHKSYTMTYLLVAMQKWSNNFMAEMIFKSLDQGDDPATWAGAQSRVQDFLGKAGLKPGSYKFTNGSGLYDANELSARQLTTLLAYMETRRDLLPDFEASLAVAGVDGTLGRRMRNTRAQGQLRAKTGTLNKVVTLTGVVWTADGRKLAFSILFNQTKGGAWGYRQIQDKIGARLARHGASRASN